jgi:hypothetical protein
MKRALLLLLLLLSSLAPATAGTISRQMAGAPGDRVEITRGELTLDAAVSSGSSTEELAVAPPDTVTVTWRSSGMEVKATVARQPGESDDGMTIRLARLVVALRKSFPVDPPVPPSGG